MPTLAEQLSGVLLALTPPTRPIPDVAGFQVKLIRQDNAAYPGRDVGGVLPFLVTGHAALSREEWVHWVMSVASPVYGTDFALRIANQGVDLRDLLPTGNIGRMLWGTRKIVDLPDSNFEMMRFFGALIQCAEKWPSLYNELARSLVNKTLSLEWLVQHIQNMPCPIDMSLGRVHTTLGDLLGATGTVYPSF